MKTFLSKFSSAVISFTTAVSCLSIHADAAENVKLKPNFQLDNPCCGEIVVCTDKEANNISFEIVQCSEEAAEQTIYCVQCKPDTQYVCELDDSEYFLRIHAPNLKNGEGTCTFEAGIEMPRKGEIVDDVAVEYSVATIQIGYQTNPYSRFSLYFPNKMTIEENTIYDSFTINFSQFDGRLGDLNGDGLVSEIDATAALTCYASSMLDDVRPTLSQLLYGDINDDNSISDVDATMILRYYAKSILDDNADWNDILSV